MKMPSYEPKGAEMNELTERSEIRVLHLGDVFLGSAFLSPTPEKSADRRRAQSEAMSRLFRYIREQEVSLTLITGNLFDEADLSDETARYLIQSMRALPRCRFVILPGPADAYREGCFYASGRLPENVTVVTEPSFERIDLDELGIALYGAAVTDPEAPPPAIPVCERKGDEVLLLGLYRSEAPSDGELSSSGADYIALSGRASPELHGIGDAWCAYSGSPESRSFEDEGVGGANLLMIVREGDERRLYVKRLDFGTCRCLSREIDVTDMKTDSDLISAVTRVVRDNNLGRGAVLRIVLKGSTRASFRIPQRFDSSSFGLLAFSLVNLTTPVLDPSLRRDMSPRGELYRLLEPKIESGSDAERATAARALTIGMAALEGKDIDNL